ncbi:hypothetical protein ACHAWF_003680, partial [Thalassiosira exigua]
MEHVSKYFPDLIAVVQELVRKEISPKNCAKLLKLLLDDLLCHQLPIELAAYTETLYPLRTICYWLETDKTDAPFKVTGKIDAFLELYANNEMCKLPSTEALIQRAIEWATTDGGFTAPDPDEVPPTRRTLADICTAVVSSRPTRRAAIQAVRNAARDAAGETEAQRERREQLEAAERVVIAAELKEQEEAARTEEIRIEVEVQSKRPPLTVEEWLTLCLVYYMSVNHTDRKVLLEFYRGARIFNPFYAKTISCDKAMELTENLRHFQAMDGGQNPLIDLLKDGWKAYQMNAMYVKKKFDFEKDGSGILTWHYRIYLRIDEDRAEDKKR